MITLLIISISIFVIYTGFIVIKFGIPTSLSDSFYLLNNLSEGLGYLFTITLFGMSFTLLPVWLSVAITNFDFLKFLCVAFLALVGAAPLFKSINNPIHGIFAMLSALTGLLWVFISTPFWYVIVALILIMGVLALITKTFKCHDFWLEMVMFISIYIVNLIYIL